MADDPSKPPFDDEKTQIARPLPPIADDEKTQIAQPLPPIEDAPTTPDDTDMSYWDEPTLPPGLAMPPAAPMPNTSTPADMPEKTAAGDLSLPPRESTPPETTGLSMPPVNAAPEISADLTTLPVSDVPAPMVDEPSIPPIQDDWARQPVAEETSPVVDDVLALTPEDVAQPEIDVAEAVPELPVDDVVAAPEDADPFASAAEADMSDDDPLTVDEAANAKALGEAPVVAAESTEPDADRPNPVVEDETAEVEAPEPLVMAVDEEAARSVDDDPFADPIEPETPVEDPVVDDDDAAGSVEAVEPEGDLPDNDPLPDGDDPSDVEPTDAPEIETTGVEVSIPNMDEVAAPLPPSDPVPIPSFPPTANNAATVIAGAAIGAAAVTASVPPAAPKPETTPPVTAGQQIPVPIGTLINNNYEIKKLINAGGMGEVFRGENVFTGDSVAIKIVLQALAHDEKVAALFMREAKVLCQLSDQAIVRYYNFVRDAELDRFCLIMEFIEGIALSDHIRDVAPLTLEQAAGLMRRVADGLDRAHKMDVIHRDLSPDNVMLRDGAVDNAVLIDFGIAKSAEMAESTLHGQLAGKFKYISPEQLGHFGGEIGPRTDIYGLGLMMAAALRGQALDMGSSVVEAVNARREIPDLSDIDSALRPLLAHMLEPDPAHRPARMSDVIGLLDNPAAIPPKYGQARPIATGQADPFTVAPVTTTQVPGLSQPPGRATTMGFGGNTTGFGGDAGSASPFGQQTGIQPAPAPPPDPVTSAGGGILRWLMVLCVFGAIGGFFAWQQGLIGMQPTPIPPTTIPGSGAPGIAGLDPDSREGFLAAWSDDKCVLATRITAGPNSGTVAAFGGTDGQFDGLLDDYAGKFGARPALAEHGVSPEQCPAISLLQALRTVDASAPLLTLDTNVMESGGSIVGKLSNRSARPVWLAWVSTQGGVYNLTDRLTEQADGSATFSFGLSAEEGAGATPQLLIAIATDNPLIAAAASAPGSSADSLLPLIEAEIAGRNDAKAGAAIVGFDLSL